MAGIIRRMFLKALGAPNPGRAVRYRVGADHVGGPDSTHIVCIAIEELETGEWVEFDRQRVTFVIEEGVMRARAVFRKATWEARLVQVQVYSVKGHVASGPVNFADNRPEPVLHCAVGESSCGESLGLDVALTPNDLFPEVLDRELPGWNEPL